MAVEIKPVASPHELMAFVKLPWQLYRGEPNWVPPLLMGVKKRLDPKKNPFFEHITGREKVHPAIWEAADRLGSEHGIVCRPFRKKDLL
jgi:hypothetical protein